MKYDYKVIIKRFLRKPIVKYFKNSDFAFSALEVFDYLFYKTKNKFYKIKMEAIK